MEPYLEQYWGDVHSRLIVYISDQINEQLPSDLQARIEESILVDAEEYTRIVDPDVHAAESLEEPRSSEVTHVGAAVAEPA